MKYLKYVVSVVLLVCLAGCYEINEEIQINADGTGSYVTKMDMSQLIDMMQTFAGEEELTKEGLDRVIDTTFSMKSLMDSAKDGVTPEQKELVKDGKMKLQMNMKEKIFKMDMNTPYKNLNGLQQLMAAQGGSGGIGEVMKSMFGKKNNEAAGLDQPAPPKDPMSEFATLYDVTVKNGLISKKVNAEKFKALSEKPEMAQVKQLASTGMEILYTTTIKLPRAAKKSDNPLMKLSDDKKTVTMRYNLLDLLEHPEKYSYTVEY